MRRGIWKKLDEFPACHGPPGKEDGYLMCNLCALTIATTIIIASVAMALSASPIE